MFRRMIDMRRSTALCYLIVLLVVSDACYGFLQNMTRPAPYQHHQVTDYSQVLLLISMEHMEGIQDFIRHEIPRERPVSIHMPNTKQHVLQVEYDRWWLTSHLRKRFPKSFYRYYEPYKGAVFREANTLQSLHSLISYFPTLPSTEAVAEPKAEGLPYWRHSERYFALISSILALLSGLLINSVMFA